MAQTISIGASQHIDLLKSRLGQKLKFLEGNGLKVDLEERPAGKLTFLFCRLTGHEGCSYAGSEEDPWAVLRQFLADIISDIILNHWEDKLLKDIIRGNYYYFDEEEKKQIYNYTLRHINRDRDNRWSTFCWSSRKTRILQKVLDFLHNNNVVIIDGFIKFRLKEYISELQEAADKAVDDFLMEREYQEFIQLLKYFVDAQEPRVGEVNVLVKNDGIYKLYDEKMQPVKEDYMKGFIIDLADNEINYEDLLVSALITIAPKNIVLHYKNNCCKPAALDTIKSVFTGRVRECTGCSLCAPV